MCGPLTLMSGGGLLGGSLLQGLARRNASDKISDLVSEEEARQNALTTAALANIGEASQSFERENFDAEMLAQEEELAENLKDVQINLEEVTPGANAPASTPQIVLDFERGEREEARDFTDALAESRARLRSFENAMVPAGIAVGRSAQRNLPVASFARGSEQAFRSEVEDARRKASSPIGDLLVGLGGIGLGYGLNGGTFGDLFTFDPTIRNIARGGMMV